MKKLIITLFLAASIVSCKKSPLSKKNVYQCEVYKRILDDTVFFATMTVRSDKSLQQVQDSIEAIPQLIPNTLIAKCK
jgi:hypothetical protein